MQTQAKGPLPGSNWSSKLAERSL